MMKMLFCLLFPVADQHCQKPGSGGDGDDAQSQGQGQLQGIEGFLNKQVPLLVQCVIHGVIQGTSRDQRDHRGDQEGGGGGLLDPGKDLRIDRNGGHGEEISDGLSRQPPLQCQEYRPGDEAAQGGDGKLLSPEVKEDAKAQRAQGAGEDLDKCLHHTPPPRTCAARI